MSKRYTLSWWLKVISSMEMNEITAILYKRLILYPLYRLTIKKYLIYKVSRRSKIRVLFLVAQQGSWKTELLYQAMEKHPRFNPVLGIFSVSESREDYPKLLDYVEKKGYNFVDLMDNTQYKRLWNTGVDIVFHQKPYEDVPRRMSYKYHLNVLYCYVAYGIHISRVEFDNNLDLLRLLWQNYYENSDVADERRKFLLCGKRSILVTGMPIFDSLSCGKDGYKDPWKRQNIEKKRIIYAPHHSLPKFAAEGIEYGTFLDNAEIMLDLAVKYGDKVQWVFKPHPVLKGKLKRIWGAERTEAYYKAWQNMDNSQLEEGEYEALFLYSDAMIHDCCSFTVEYHLTGKPVLFLVNGKEHHSKLSCLGRTGYDLNYKARTKDEIEQFINNVINGVDPLLPSRLKFRNEKLVAPYGKTACENIINAILGEAEYKNTI